MIPVPGGRTAHSSAGNGNHNVGPTLGQDSITSGFRAGVVGVVLVFIFMAVYYKIPGLIADLALVLYIVIVLGVLSGMSAVLTLPGIAGLILSIGMAVDANVLIFDASKERQLAASVCAPLSRPVQPGIRYDPGFQHHHPHFSGSPVLLGHRAH